MDVHTPPFTLAHAADWRLAQRALAGHPTAWMELVRACQGIVMALLVRHVPAPEREDAFQEAFLRIHRHLGTYRGEAALSTWVFQVTLNLIRTRWEAERQRTAREVLATDWRSPDEDGAGTAWDVPVQPSQEEEAADAERREVLRKLRALIAGMKPLDRQVLLLRDVDGCPYDQIAARMQVPMGTIKSRLARARANLATALQAGASLARSR
ncbi:MAG: sigma-70 family RNA polymerase sigma factor [Holophaga sp.]|jgi:RNA polymerase sigma-70 factor (ECF subfamily)